MLIGLLACGAAFGLATQKTNMVNLVLANVCDGTFNDFKFQLSGYDDQVFKFNYDVSLSGVAASFRITKPMDGTIYLDVPITSVTISGTNATFSIARSNIPPPGSYYGELLSYEANSTNFYRSLAQGKLPVTWSLYLNESNFFARATNTVGIGQVYVHPNWIDPPWLSSTGALGTVYFTIANSLVLSNWTDIINTKATNNLASITALQGYTNAAMSVYNWGNHATNGYITNTTETLWPAVSNTVTVNAENGATAYGWGDWSLQGFISGSTNLFTALTVGDRSKLGANLTSLTSATGSLTSVSFTTAVSLVIGKTYDYGFTFANYGTGTLSIAGNSLIRTTAGSSSNYFTYHSGEGSNLVIKLDGTGSGIGNATLIYCKNVTGGTVNVAGNLNIAGDVTLDGALFQNPAAATNSMTVRITAVEAATNILNIASNSLQSQSTLLAGATNSIVTVFGGATSVLNLATGSLNGVVGLLQDATNVLNSASNNLGTRVGNIEGWPTNAWATSGATNVTPGAGYSWDSVTRTVTVNSNAFGGAGGGAGTITNMLSDAVTSIVWTASGGPQPVGSITNYLQSIGITTDNFFLAAGTNMQFNPRGVTTFVDNAYTFNDTALKGATSVLNTATGSLDAAITVLKGSTSVLNSATGSLDGVVTSLKGATNVLNLATNGLQVQIVTLNGATGVLNSATGSLNGVVINLQGATGVLNTATGSLNTAITTLNGATSVLNTATGSLSTAVTALQGATNAINTVANAALPKAGGVMSGNLNFGTNSSTNATSYGFSNSVVIKVGQLNGTNGMCLFNAANGSNYWILFR